MASIRPIFIHLVWQFRTFSFHVRHILYKKLSYRRGTARCVVSVEILPIATQQCRNYLYDMSWTKYQLSLIDSCDKIVLYTALDDLCDKLYSGQTSELGGIIDLVDRRRPPVYHALSVHLSRAKLITRFDDRYAVAKFSIRPEFRTKFQREVPLFLEITECHFSTE